ncbi:MAG: AzlC family ABC transporter permease [Clostridia bacterium]|nr:AzlC family ABC transporter permease [Clostridia bacterium]
MLSYIMNKNVKKDLSQMRENNSFKMGLRDGIPIFLGYLSVSFAFGITAMTMGLTIIEALLISMTNLTSAGQLAGLPIIAGSGSLIELAVTQLVINLRYSLMSVSLSQKLGESVKMRHRFLIAFGNTDEIFAVSTSKPEMLGRKYFFGLILMPYIGWSSGTLLGAVAGNILPQAVISALGIAIYGMFIAILVPAAKSILQQHFVSFQVL